MKFDAAEEQGHQQRLREAWTKIDRDINTIELLVRGLSHRMRASEEVARYHLDQIREIADSPVPIVAAHMILMDCHRRGHGVEADPQAALHHLEKAMGLGSNEARWWYASFLAGTDGLEDVLAQDPAKALEIYRELAWDDRDISVMSLARFSAVPMLIKGKHAGQLSARDEEMVRQYSDNWQEVSSHHYYDLARFYSDGVASRDYSAPQYRRARDMLIRGMETSRVADVQRKCEDLLDQWDVKPVAPLPPTRTQKVVEGAKTTVSLAYVALVLIVWSFIGLGLLAITSWISLFIGLPIVLIIVVGGIVSMLRRR